MTRPKQMQLVNATNHPVTPSAQMHLAYITRHWLTIATLAWDGYTQSGRGAIVIAPGTRSDATADESRIGYLPDTFVQQHSGWKYPQMRNYLHTYNPQTGVVVIVQAVAAGEVIYYVVQTPPPPDAAQQWHNSTQRTQAG
ncbi:MAG: hypothetical protein HC837_05260 [Chloroflexaceae bacterium]|nr:hypothetical protein [Chloroflexaceae bacterium]